MPAEDMDEGPGKRWFCGWGETLMLSPRVEQGVEGVVGVLGLLCEGKLKVNADVADAGGVVREGRCPGCGAWA